MIIEAANYNSFSVNNRMFLNDHPAILRLASVGSFLDTGVGGCPLSTISPHFPRSLLL